MTTRPPAVVGQVAGPVRSAFPGEVCSGCQVPSVDRTTQPAGWPFLRRSVTVGVLATAVVAGSATGVLAAPAGAPLAEVAVDETLAPVLHGKATAAGSGSQSIRFSARTVGAATWDLLNAVSVAGTDAFRALPEGRLAIGQAFEYQIAHCDGSVCTTSPVQTGYASPALGAGERPGATRLPFTVGDRVGAQVDVGSGNLLLTADLFFLSRRSGTPLQVGLAYNSLTRRAEAQFDGSVGRFSSGWRLSTGADVRLQPAAGGSVVYAGPDGLTGAFMPDGSGGFTAPAGFKITLTAASGGGWTLVDHGSGDTRSFDAGGRMTKLADRNGNATVFGYEADGSLTSIKTDVGTDGASTLTVSTEGAGRGRITTIAQTADGYDGATRSVTLAYDTNGDLASMTDAEGRVTEFFHGAQGNLNRVTAPGGAATSFTYDDAGRVQTVTQPTADAAVTAVTTMTYEARRTVVADPNGNRTTYDLTGDGRKLVEKATDPAGNARSTTYTPQLDVSTATDPAGAAMECSRFFGRRIRLPVG